MKSQYFPDEAMARYVEFLCSLINEDGGADVQTSEGISMKGLVPAKVETIEIMKRSALIRVTALEHSEEFIFYISRRKSPEELIFKLQGLINDAVSSIINRNGMDRNEIHRKHHPLTKLFSKLKNGKVKSKI